MKVGILKEGTLDEKFIRAISRKYYKNQIEIEIPFTRGELGPLDKDIENAINELILKDVFIIIYHTDAPFDYKKTLKNENKHIRRILRKLDLENVFTFIMLIAETNMEEWLLYDDQIALLAGKKNIDLKRVHGDSKNCKKVFNEIFKELPDKYETIEKILASSKPMNWVERDKTNSIKAFFKEAKNVMNSKGLKCNAC